MWSNRQTQSHYQPPKYSGSLGLPRGAISERLIYLGKKKTISCEIEDFVEILLCKLRMINYTSIARTTCCIYVNSRRIDYWRRQNMYDYDNTKGIPVFYISYHIISIVRLTTGYGHHRHDVSLRWFSFFFLEVVRCVSYDVYERIYVLFFPSSASKHASHSVDTCCSLYHSTSRQDRKTQKPNIILQ